jgi:hypothetical protein
LALIAEQAELGANEGQQGELAQHMLAHLICNQRRTVTGLLTALGRQQQDWTKAYRLYRQHVDEKAVFLPVLDGVLQLLPSGMPLVIALDDSYLKKSGRHVAGAGWYRDPLGPPFHVNLMYAQRFIQLSAAVPDPTNPKRSRMIPIAIKMIPKLPKPAKNASKQDWAQYEQLRAMNSPGVHAQQLLQQVRDHLDAYTDQQGRSIWVCGDGDYSNSTLLPKLPARTVYIGRTRADICLRSVPKCSKNRRVGRPRAYGKKLPTPEQLRKDTTIPWLSAEICNGPKTTTVRYKHISRAKWHIAGEKRVVQVVIIAPMRYRKKKNGDWSYTQPAYLVCTDAHIPIIKLIQAYFWRWGIEVNFKEEKQLFGVGQTQVRTTTSVSSAPAICIATYSTLLLAGIQAYGFHSRPPSVCPPKWYVRKNKQRPTCSDLIRQLQQDLLLGATSNFSPLASIAYPKISPTKLDQLNSKAIAV